jgi:hypothetical protein
MSWIWPVYDRTIYDLKGMTAKGKCTYTDFNRICGDINHMASLLGLNIKLKYTWVGTDVPVKADWDAIVNAVVKLGQALQPLPDEYLDLSYLNSPPDFTDFNKVEQDLLQMYLKNNALIDSYPRSGGEEFYGYVL